MGEGLSGEWRIGPNERTGEWTTGPNGVSGHVWRRGASFTTRGRGERIDQPRHRGAAHDLLGGETRRQGDEIYTNTISVRARALILARTVECRTHDA